MKSCEDSQGLIATKARGASTSVPSVFKPPAVMPHSITKVDVVSLGAFVPDNETKNEIFHTGIPPIGASTGNASPAKLWKGGNPWYETILLLGDPETVLSVLDVLDGLGNKSGSNGGGTVPTTPSLQTPAPGGTKSPSTPLTTTSLNTRLQALIEIADPSQSIMDISFHLDEPIEEVRFLVFQSSSALKYVMQYPGPHDGKLSSDVGFGRDYSIGLYGKLLSITSVGTIKFEQSCGQSI